MTTQNYPELTLRTYILGFFLALLLSASNAYLGLKMGIAAGAIPATVIAVAVLYLFKDMHLLQYNIVQIAASAGQSVGACIVFTVPALLMLGIWQEFHYLDTFLIGLIGGTLGILFTVPLRRALIIEKKLPYPEGKVIAQIIKTAQKNTEQENGMAYLLQGGIVAAIFTLFQAGFKIISSGINIWTQKSGMILGLGMSFSPLMIAAGYIIGFSTVTTVAIGNMITWQVAMPIMSLLYPEYMGSDISLTAQVLYQKHFRFACIGAITFGGIWGLITLFKPILKAIRSTYSSSTQRDIPMSLVLGLIVFMTVPLLLVFLRNFLAFDLPITPQLIWVAIITCTIFAIILGFAASSIAAYIAGISGSTTLPLTGLSIAAISFIAVLLMGILGTELAFDDPRHATYIAGITVIFGAIICLCAGIGGDNMQDLRAGYELGSTPWKQQFILFVGVAGGTIAIAPILNLLLHAYGIGDVLPRDGMDPSKALIAPHAMMITTITEGIFLGGFDQLMFMIGIFIAVCVTIIDNQLARRNCTFRIPALVFGLGMYLPMPMVATLFLGGLLERLVTTKTRGTLIAAGLIAGEALTGILLAIPFSLSDKGENALAISQSIPIASIFAFIGMVYLIYFNVKKEVTKS